jgi:hypothetical protein
MLMISPVVGAVFSAPQYPLPSTKPKPSEGDPLEKLSDVIAVLSGSR